MTPQQDCSRNSLRWLRASQAFNPYEENVMGDQGNEGKQNMGQGSMDPNKKPDQKQQGERAGQGPQDKHEKDRASNPQNPGKQDPQFDPSHINQGGRDRESTR
jgi:hypothetical protein